MNLIDVENLNSGYEKDKVVLKDISFEVGEGEFLGIIGPNGSGKTTLLKSLSGIIKPFKGKVLLNNRDVYKMSLREIARACAFVSSDTSIAFPFSVLDIVLMGRIPHIKNLGGYSKNDIRIVRESLELTDSTAFINRPIYTLSAGERQRVFLAKMLAQEPRVVFLDEPTTHLDIGHQIQILSLLKRFNQQGKFTIVVVLHDLNLASEFCTRLILLNNGKIEKAASPEEVLTYEIIEKVYNTLVIVSKNPVSSKPHILLVKEEEKI
ncbi:MAG: ABC transporter ATP-binding protein [Candidatus Omnitrophica bacterium]|nr:ABC transporter ATP-binding protein [Candidatus Omnitrophota bacterium]